LKISVLLLWFAWFNFSFIKEQYCSKYSTLLNVIWVHSRLVDASVLVQELCSEQMLKNRRL